MAILSRELASDHRLHNSLPSSTPMGASRFLLLQGPSQRRHVWCNPFIPAWHKAESVLFWLVFIINSCMWEPLSLWNYKKVFEKKQQWIICRFFFLPPSSPTNPVLKIRHRNNSQQQFWQVCACIWYKQTKICAFCFIELTSIWQNLNHKTEILWLINTSGDEK